jgi:hypothetical protein
LPVGFVVQFAVPHAVTQVLAVLPIVLHVDPVGHVVSSTHWMHRSAGSIVIPVGRRSHSLFVAWLAQPALSKH